MPDRTVFNEHISRHYAGPDLKDRILATLDELEKERSPLSPEDISPLDEFHIRGRLATRELAQILHPTPAHRVLDVGSGIGGPSRCLVHDYGCHVTGIDLTPEYCEVARILADRVGLSEKLTFRQGNALDLPFPEASFDIVWTQHTSMNIDDKHTLYAEMYRVLKPEGRIALYDVTAGPEGMPYFPLPWAQDSSMNFLLTPGELQNTLAESGFTLLHWCDTSELGLQWFQNMAAKKRESNRAPALGLHMLMGPEIRTMSRNVMKNLTEKRIVLIEAIAQKSS